jgi:hypothetical protein
MAPPGPAARDAAHPDAEPHGMFGRIAALAAVLWAVLWAEGTVLSLIQGKRLGTGMWSYWDAPHYLQIVRHGYVRAGRNALWIVFPPAYPFLTRVLALVLRSPLTSALAGSFVASVVGAWFVYRLLRLDVTHEEAWRAVVFLLMFPTAYFLAAPYSESLFLLAAAGAMYAARTNHWARAGAAGILTTATRLPGIALVPALAIEALASPTDQKESVRSIQRLRKLVWTLVAPAGLGVFLLANWIVHRNPLYFLKVEAGRPWWQHAVPPWASLWDAAGQLLGVVPHAPHTADWTLHARLAAAVFAVVVLVLARHRLRLSYQVFAWSSLLFYLSASRLISLPRYLAPIFPLHAALASRTASRRVFLLLAGAGFAMELFLFGRYSQGSWTF